MAEGQHHGTGHRARLRKRLFEGGPDALLDHELVEYLLALAIPRRDTKPLAKTLIDEFGGLGALLSADPEAIAAAGGMSRRRGRRAQDRRGRGAPAAPSRRSRSKPMLGSWQALLDYLRADMAHPADRAGARALSQHARTC